jgi:hypothetical protein
MTDLPDPTPEVRAAIARLCGGVPCGSSGDYWKFERECGGYLSIYKDSWLDSRFRPVADVREAIQESILMRGLARAGVLFGVTIMPTDSWCATPTDGSASVFGPTPIAALVALAAAHVEARKEGGK